ncbi:MAG: Omp28-related outer membrane protein [Chlorobi bacterium]|nr:Omp28-related outer membrane protein [Chlorobiota bacterium]
MKKFTLLFLSIVFLSIITFAQKNKNKVLDKIKIYDINNSYGNTKTVTDWISYCGDPAHSIGMGSAADFGCFIHIPASLLAAHDGRQIQEVMVQIKEPENVASCELRIYEEAGSGTPGTPVFTQSFTPNADGTAWTTIYLAPPFTIDASKELMVGYFGNFTGGYPASCDDGPVNTDGNFMIWNGAWTHLKDLSSTLTYNWNIKVGIGDASANDAGLTNITTESLISEGNIDITGSVFNFGTNQINSLDLNWQIDNGTVHSETVNSLNLNTGDSYNFTHGTQWNATSGDYTLKVWNSNMNGNGNDDNTANDTLTKNIKVIRAVDVAWDKLFTPFYSLPGNVSISGKIINTGENNLTSFDVTYNIDGGTESPVYSVTNINIPYGGTYNFTHDVPYNFMTVGNYMINTTIANVNGGGETYLDDNTKSKNIVISDTATQRMVLLEQFTTEKCSNCPPALTTLEHHFSDNPYFIMMCNHSGYYTDWLTVPVNSTQLEFYNNGGSTYAPAGMFDREYNGLDNDEYDGADPGPVFWDGDPFGPDRIDARSAEASDVTVNIDGTYSNNGNLNITVNGKFLKDISHSVGVSLWLTEDSIAAHNQSGASNWMHRYTIRNVISQRLGDEITTSTNAGDTYEKSFSYTLNSSWNTNQLYLVAMVNNLSNTVNDRTVRNAVQVKLTNLQYVLSVKDIDENNFSVYPNPTTDIIKISNIGSADMKIYDLIGNLVLAQKNISNGQNINVSNLKNGTYFIKLTTENNVRTEKFIISR